MFLWLIASEIIWLYFCKQLNALKIDVIYAIYTLLALIENFYNKTKTLQKILKAE
jgi:hypothetical protein